MPWAGIQGWFVKEAPLPFARRCGSHQGREHRGLDPGRGLRWGDAKKVFKRRKKEKEKREDTSETVPWNDAGSLSGQGCWECVLL